MGNTTTRLTQRFTGRLTSRPWGSGASTPWYQNAAYKADNTLPVLILDFINQRYAVNGAETTFSDLFTFTRSGTAYYFNSSGVLTSAATNTPRFTYDPQTLSPKGLLMEPQRTNNLLYSDDLTNAAWTKTNCTAAKDATGPDGVSSSASTLTATGADATCLQPRTLASSARAFSVYLKRKTGGGTVSITRDGGTTWTDITSSLSSFEYVKLKIENSSVLNPSCGIKISTSGDAVYVFGAQDEDGNYASSYIPTTATTATRSVDVCTNGSGNTKTFLSWYSTTSGTFYSNDMTSPSYDGDNLLSVNAGTNFMDLAASAGFTYYRVYNGGFIISPATAHTRNVAIKRAISYEANNFGYYKDGSQVSSGGSGSPPSDINQFRLNGSHGNTYMGVLYYNFRVTNSELARITT